METDILNDIMTETVGRLFSSKPAYYFKRAQPETSNGKFNKLSFKKSQPVEISSGFAAHQTVIVPTEHFLLVVIQSELPKHQQ